MLTDLFQRYEEIIASWSVSHFDREGPDLRLKARVVFTDGSELHIRQIVIDGAMMKYAYHWQTSAGILIARWDNAEHWPDIVTFPHHKHVRGDDGTSVQPSQGAELSLVMEEIAARFHSRSQS